VAPARSERRISVQPAKPAQELSFILSEEELREQVQRRDHTTVDVALLDRKTTEMIFVVTGCCCFSFLSGYVNGCALNGFGQDNGDYCDVNNTMVAGVRQSVTGFTGGYTKAALNAAEGAFTDMGFEFGTIFCFVGGSFFCGLFMPNRKPFELGPMFGPLFLLGSAFAVMAVVFAYLGYDERAPYYWLALNSGISNGMTSIYSGGLIRSSNLTGPLTDIGIAIGKYFRGELKDAWRLRIRVVLAVAFWVGALCSWWATESIQYKALIVNAGFFFAVGVAFLLYISKKHNLSILDAAFGKWDWHDTLKMLASREDGRSLKEFELVALFDTFDADGNGTIDAREFAAALLTECKKGVPIKMVQDMLDSADVDGDREISLDEFIQLMSKHVDVDDSGINITSEGVTELVDRRKGRRASRQSYDARMIMDNVDNDEEDQDDSNEENRIRGSFSRRVSNKTAPSELPSELPSGIF